jgi:hypothetical protein
MRKPQSKKPLDTINLAEEVSKGFDESDKLSARLDRYSIAKKRALENQKYLADSLLQFAAERCDPDQSFNKYDFARKTSVLLAGCGNYLKFNHYYTVGKVRLRAASFCRQHLICPLCAIRRGAKTLKAYIDRYSVIRALNPSWRLSMITLTVKNGDNLKERFEHLQKAVQRIFERRRDWLKKGRGLTEWRKVHGYVGTYELTNQGKGWHPHAHIMVLHTDNFDYKALQAEWKDITGDSHVLNVAAAQHPDQPELDFLEVFKYAVKFSDLTPADNLKAFLILRRRRLLFSGGAFRGVEVPEALEDEPLDNLPYIELMYRFAFGAYSLTSSEMVEAPPPVEPATAGADACGVKPAETAEQQSQSLPAKKLERQARKRWLDKVAAAAGADVPVQSLRVKPPQQNQEPEPEEKQLVMLQSPEP